MRDAFTPSLLRISRSGWVLSSFLLVAALLLDCFREGRFARSTVCRILIPSSNRPSVSWGTTPPIDLQLRKKLSDDEAKPQSFLRNNADDAV